MNDAKRLAQIQDVLAARGAAAVGSVIDGLGALLANARAGDVRSRAILRQLTELLDEVEHFSAIVVPSDLAGN